LGKKFGGGRDKILRTRAKEEASFREKLTVEKKEKENVLFWKGEGGRGTLES